MHSPASSVAKPAPSRLRLHDAGAVYNKNGIVVAGKVGVVAGEADLMRSSPTPEASNIAAGEERQASPFGKAGFPADDAGVVAGDAGVDAVEVRLLAGEMGVVAGETDFFARRGGIRHEACVLCRRRCVHRRLEKTYFNYLDTQYY